MLSWWVAPIFVCALGYAQTPVLVELFTSEGCSSCPPADKLLQALEAGQPVAGAHIIVLSEHVDYWDRLGWRDPFSSAQFTERQQDYSRLFRDAGPYTPEMVVDGVVGFTGNDRAEALRTIAHAARAAKAAVRVSGGAGKLSIDADAVKHGADVMLAITERNLLSQVARGENAGRRLTHTAVVRSLRVIGKARPGEPFHTETAAPLDKAWKGENLHVVVWLQEHSSRRVLGAAEIPLGL
jgi:hypothetical protein